ncbi:serine/threonine protein kinase [Emergomyces africanus]|uniref:Serine/threonine protein kinase n=1 Tax=Emergomyces africanus TaxID=1955775 RepID=A0A1B7P0D4_9EURO|nr:serine/threonine protein kinase [Emergomyces africanus]
MENPNLIARIYPFQKSPDAVRAINDPGNSSRHLTPILKKEVAVEPRSRDSTPERDFRGDLDHLYLAGLELTFDNRPKGDKGFCIGRDAGKCDILLPDLDQADGISACHCHLTFDSQNRLILRDESRNGTIVTYDNKGAESRRNFTWILGGHLTLRRIQTIVIEFNENLQFKIVVPKAWADPNRYTANIKNFTSRTNRTNDLYLGELGISSGYTTAVRSQIQTPHQGRILIELDKLGSGGFGDVTHHWDVSTGVEYACKKPRNILTEREKQLWEKEIRIMTRTSHDHIVKFYPARDNPVPCLYLDYLPGGNLMNQHRVKRFSREEMLIILSQCLSALKYLHEQNPSIAHRDLKPENILVRSRQPLQVQLADFGLAKEGASLKSQVGTRPYFPPEFATAHWCKAVIERAKKFKNEDLMVFLTTHMLVLNPEARSSAEACLNALEELSAHPRDGSRTPTPASLAEVSLPAGESALPDNAISSEAAPASVEAPLETNASLPGLRKRSAELCSSSDTTIKRPKRRARTANNRQQNEQNDSEFKLFHPNWLLDPNCVGSSVADMGREDPSGWSSLGNSSAAIANATENRRPPPDVDEQGDGFGTASERPISHSEKELVLILQNDLQR